MEILLWVFQSPIFLLKHRILKDQAKWKSQCQLFIFHRKWQNYSTQEHSRLEHYGCGFLPLVLTLGAGCLKSSNEARNTQ
jgi:hypothetical protein